MCDRLAVSLKRLDKEQEASHTCRVISVVKSKEKRKKRKNKTERSLGYVVIVTLHAYEPIDSTDRLGHGSFVETCVPWTGAGKS